MKQKLLSMMLLLFALVAGTISVLGQAPVDTHLWEETWTGGDANETPSAYGFEGTTVYGGATLTYAQSSTNTKLYTETLAGGTSPELLLSKSNQTWTISNIPTGQATEMSLTFKSNKTTFAVTSTTEDITISGSGVSWTISATSSVANFNLTIKNTGSSNARVDDILLKVTTAGSSGGSSLTASDLAITGAPVALSFDLYNNSTAQTVSYTTSSTGAVTVSGGTGYVTTSVSGNTITVTPVAVTPSAQTITISQEADATYNAGSKTFTVTVTDSSPISNIAGLTAKPAGTYEVSLTDALVTYINGKYAYLEDASGAVLLYNCANDLAVGDKITGTADVTYTVYNSLPEVTAFALQTGYTKTSGNTVNPTEVTLAALLDNYNSYLSRYVLIKKATVTSAFSSKNCTIEQNGSTIVLRDQNSSATLTSSLNDVVNVTAHVAIYNTTKQIAVYEQSQIVGMEKHAFNFGVSPVASGTITVLDEGANDVTSGALHIEGSELTISASANTGYVFNEWTATGLTIAEGDRTNADLDVTMPDNEVTLTANFVPQTYTLSTTSEHGTLAVTVNGEAWNGTDKIPYGATVSVRATADTNWAFSAWDATLGAYDSSSNPLVFTMPASDVALEAQYVDASTVFTVTYYVAGVENEVSRAEDAQLNLPSPSPVNGMQFVGWSASDVISATPVFVPNTTAVTSDMTLYAVFAAQSSISYVKQTTGTVEDGEYLIVYETDAVAFDGSLDPLDVTENTVSVTIDGTTIEGSTDAINSACFSIASVEGGYTIRSASGKYIGQTSNVNGLGASDDPSAYTNTIAFSDGDANIVSAGAYLRYNSASNQLRFRYYKSSSYTGQKAIQLYKKNTVIAGYTLGLPETVSISSAKYATFCAAQPVDFSATGITVYTAKVEGDVVKLTEVEDGIVPANTGVVLYSNEVKNNVSVPAIACSKTLSNNEMVGITERTQVDATDGAGKYNYILSNEDAGVGFYAATNDIYLAANKAYLSTTVDPTLLVKAFLGFTEGDADAISEIVNGKSVNGKWYDLSGRRVSKATKGIYIVNGKKVVK